MTEQEEEAVAFGERLRKLRLATGLSQAKVGRRAGATVSVVSLIERGAYGTPGAPLVERLADAMGYTVEELLGNTGYEPPPDGRAGRETRALRSPEAARLIEPGQVHPLMAELRLARQQTCSQAEAARRMGNSMQGVAINNWEYGIHQPSLPLFVELARALGFKVVLEPLKEGE